MVRFQGDTLIARPVEDVFDLVADELAEPSGNSLMLRAEKTTAGPVGEGTHWSATILSHGRPLEVDIVVTSFERPHRLGSLTTMSAADVEGVLSFEPHPAGTRMSWTWELRPKGVYRLMGPVLTWPGQEQVAEMRAGLKRYLEDGRPAP